MKNPLDDELTLGNSNEKYELKISESTKPRKLSLKRCTVWIEPILLITFAMGVILLCFYGMRQLNPKNVDPGYDFYRFREDGADYLPPKQKQAVLNLRKLSKLIIYDSKKKFPMVMIPVSPVDHATLSATFINVKLSDDDLVDLRSLPTLSMLTIDSCSELTDQFLKYIADSTQLTYLDLRKLNITDQGLKHLSGLVQLDSLDLSYCKAITSYGMSHLKNLKHLRSLGLSNTKVSDAGLKQLKGMTNLEGLGLSRTLITDKGLVHLSGMTKLKGLSLNRTAVTDSGLLYLKNMNELKSLNLDHTKITGVGFAHLRTLEQLEYLDLSFSQLSNSGIEQISYLKSLKTLALGNTGISDEGIRHLKELPNLEYLSLYNTQITVTGVKELQTALPGCTIKFE